MTDCHTPERRSFNMSQVKGRDTIPEMRVRRMLHAEGLRYRLHGKLLPGRPDLVFAGPRAVVFVHGCFWHVHGCRYGKPIPATNVEFWSRKRASNVERDVRNRAALAEAGWRVFEIWECETKDQDCLRLRVAEVVDFVRNGRTPRGESHALAAHA